MNYQHFIELLKYPNRINNFDIQEIDGLVNSYPYFQTAHLLLTKGLQNTQNIRFNNEFKKTACFVSNRNLLYDILNKSIVKLNYTNNSETFVAEKTDTKLITEDETIIENIELTNEPLADENIIKDTIIISKKIEEEEVKETEEVDELSDLYKNHLKTMQFKIYDIEKNLTEQDKKEEEPLVEEDKSDDNKVKKFSEWIKQYNPKPENNDKTENSETVIDKKKVIIDTFIKNRPQVSKPKTEFYSASNMAQKSIIESSDIVSETLAEIYFKQNNFSKAIETYKKLMLIFPEKSSLFAKKIDFIKNNNI